MDINCIPDKYFTWFNIDFVGRPTSEVGYQKLPSAKINVEHLKDIKEDEEEEEQRRDMRSLATKNKRNLDERDKNKFK